MQSWLDAPMHARFCASIDLCLSSYLCTYLSLYLFLWVRVSLFLSEGLDGLAPAPSETDSEAISWPSWTATRWGESGTYSKRDGCGGRSAAKLARAVAGFAFRGESGPAVETNDLGQRRWKTSIMRHRGTFARRGILANDCVQGQLPALSPFRSQPQSGPDAVPKLSLNSAAIGPTRSRCSPDAVHPITTPNVVPKLLRTGSKVAAKRCPTQTSAKSVPQWPQSGSSERDGV